MCIICFSYEAAQEPAPQRRIQPSAEGYIALCRWSPEIERGVCETLSTRAQAGGALPWGVWRVPRPVLGLTISSPGAPPPMPCSRYEDEMRDTQQYYAGRGVCRRARTCHARWWWLIFFSVLAHRLGVACLALSLSCIPGLCSDRKFLCCLLASTRFSQLRIRRPGRSVDSLGKSGRPLETASQL